MTMPAHDADPATGLEHIRTRLALLRQLPPQVLLFEGGTESERLDLARWWASLLNCPHTNMTDAAKAASGFPCQSCPSCERIAQDCSLNVLLYDGRISNKEEEENTSGIRALTMDNVRALKARLRDAPHDAGKRAVILFGLDLSRLEAANALLKVLEEPSPTTVFVLLAAQRTQLLPTLVSRSWVVTLPWPDITIVEDTLLPWENALTAFLQAASLPQKHAPLKQWQDLTGAKGSVNTQLAAHIVLLCQKRLALAARPDENNLPPLANCLRDLPPHKRLHFLATLDKAQELLAFAVNPARILDWLAASFFAILRDDTATV